MSQSSNPRDRASTGISAVTQDEIDAALDDYIECIIAIGKRLEAEEGLTEVLKSVLSKRTISVNHTEYD